MHVISACSLAFSQVWKYLDVQRSSGVCLKIFVKYFKDIVKISIFYWNEQAKTF